MHIDVVVLDGWASSLRPGDMRTSGLVESVLVEVGMSNAHVLDLKSRIARSRSRKVRKSIEARENPDTTLLCVGKSLGATNIVKRVLNKCGRLNYDRVCLFTIDPNWPTFRDWSPNLNDDHLVLTYPVSRAVNIYVKAHTPRQQAGARLVAPATTEIANVQLPDADHYSVVQHPTTRLRLIEVMQDIQRP